MGSNRAMPRIRRRLQVKFSGPGASGMGFTENISATGMLLHSMAACKPGLTISGTMTIPGAGEVPFEARVTWLRRITGPLAQFTKNSMGVTFTRAPDEAFYRLLTGPGAG